MVYGIYAIIRKNASIPGSISFSSRCDEDEEEKWYGYLSDF
jgi:hypothetical protein